MQIEILWAVCPEPLEGKKRYCSICQVGRCVYNSAWKRAVCVFSLNLLNLILLLLQIPLINLGNNIFYLCHNSWPVMQSCIPGFFVGLVLYSRRCLNEMSGHSDRWITECSRAQLKDRRGSDIQVQTLSQNDPCFHDWTRCSAGTTSTQHCMLSVYREWWCFFSLIFFFIFSQFNKCFHYWCQKLW